MWCLSLMCFFPEQPTRGGTEAGKPGVWCFILTIKKKTYSKALGKDGILNVHENSSVHHSAAEKADVFSRNFKNPPERNDNRLLKDQVEHKKVNKEILCLIVHAIEFLAK